MALEGHADGCDVCREEMRIWRDISVAAQTMHKDWPTPALWPRIESALEIETAKPRGWRSWIYGMRLGASAALADSFSCPGACCYLRHGCLAALYINPLRFRWLTSIC